MGIEYQKIHACLNDCILYRHEFQEMPKYPSYGVSPPNSPPPPTSAASQSPSTLKRTRKATRLRSLASRLIRAERPLVHVDPATRKADCPHRKLRTYLGIVAREKVDVTYEN